MVDVVDHQVEEALGRWLKVLPGVPLQLFVYPWNRARVAQFAESRGSGVGLTLAADDWPLDDDRLATVCVDCWATCAAYDSSGVHVKREIEALLLPTLAGSGAILLAHDPAYGIVRILQARDVQTRLEDRLQRLRIYRVVCRMVFGFAWIAARLPGASATKADRSGAQPHA